MPDLFSANQDLCSSTTDLFSYNQDLYPSTTDLFFPSKVALLSAEVRFLSAEDLVQ
jgi:hypothetical protein